MGATVVVGRLVPADNDGLSVTFSIAWMGKRSQFDLAAARSGRLVAKPLAVAFVVRDDEDFD